MLANTLVPKKYRGFDITISLFPDDEAPNGLIWSVPNNDGKKYKYIYAYDGKYHNGVYFDEDKTNIEIWNKIRPVLDKSIDRLNTKLRISRRTKQSKTIK